MVLALVGIGDWGRSYIGTIKKISDCNLKYIASQTSESLKKIDGDYIKTTNYRDFFKHPIDGVIIATPGSTHFKIASEFIERGFNVLVEKPLTTSYQDALKLQATFNKKKVKVLVGHTMLYNPAFTVLQDLSKNLGRIRHIRFTGANFGPFRSDMSVIWDWGPHAISACLTIFGKEPKKIRAWAVNTLRPETKFYDLVLINLIYEDNVEVFIEISWISPIKKRNMIIVGENDSIIFDDMGSKKLIYLKNSTSIISYPTYSRQLPLTLEVMDFINAIKNDTQPISDLELGVKTSHILSLVEQSIKKGGEFVENNTR